MYFKLSKDMFSGLACFSPSVPSDIQSLWCENGGQIARSAHEKRHSTFYFCDGPRDPWLTELSIDGCRVVFHAQWVRACVDEGYGLPIATYVLDERFEALNKLGVAQPQPNNAAPIQFTSSPTGGTSQFSDLSSSLSATKRHLSLTPANSPSKRSKSSDFGNSSDPAVLSDVTFSSPLCSSRKEENKDSITPNSQKSAPKPAPSKHSIKPFAVLIEKPGQDIPHIFFGGKPHTDHFELRAQKVPGGGHRNSLPPDYWASIARDATAEELAAFEGISVAIPVAKVLESASHAVEQELSLFKPGLVHKGKLFSCVEHDRRKTV